MVPQSYREDGKVKHRTLANLSKLPAPAVDAVRAVLRGKQVGPLATSIEILRALPHGAVLAVLGELRQLGLDKLIAARPPTGARTLDGDDRQLRIPELASKLATVRGWQNSTLASELGVEDADEDGLYAAMDWLCASSPRWSEAGRASPERGRPGALRSHLGLPGRQQV